MNQAGRAVLTGGCGLLLIVAGCAPAPATSNTPGSGTAVPASIVDPYLKIAAALASGTMDEVTASAGNIATAAAPFGSPAFRIGASAAALTSAVELPDARDKFGRLSDAVITYMDGLHLSPPEGVHIASCETTRQQWLQQGDTIANPYDGSSAPACGSFR